MRRWASKCVFLLYACPIAVGFIMAGCSTDSSTSGCGGTSSQVTCGEGTKKVQNGSSYECVPNTN